MASNTIVRACPDGGRCHHQCGPVGGCWRVEAAEPLSGVFPSDVWPLWLLEHPWWVTKAGQRWAGPFTYSTAQGVATMLNLVAPDPATFAYEQQADEVPTACALCGASPLPPVGTGMAHRCHD